MSRTRRTLAFKGKVWGNGDSMMEFDGDLASGIKYAFFYLPAAERVKLLGVMAADHAKLLESEGKLEIVPARGEA